MSGHRDFRIIGKTELRSGFLSVDEIEFEFRKFDGQMSGPLKHEIMERGDSVAVLAFDKRLGALVLVKQFRVAAALNPRPKDAWLLEIPAGKVEHGETDRETARRELEEETGYVLRDRNVKSEDLKKLERFRHIGTAYVSPGGTTERVHLYYVEVDEELDRLPSAGGGNRAEREDIKVLHMTPEEAYRAIDAGDIADAKTIIALQWFRQQSRQEPSQTKEHERHYYRFNQFGMFTGGGPVIGFKIGDIGCVHDVDVWVNSENTDMLMDRFFGRSISSRVRYLGAEKADGERIVKDTIATELREALGSEFFIRPGDHRITGPGYLRYAPHNVRRIVHVASVQGAPGRDMKADPAVSRDGVTKALHKVHMLNEAMRTYEPRYRSILIPLLGAGQGGVKAEAIAGQIVPAVVEFLTAYPGTALQNIYFAAYTDWDYRVLSRALDRFTAREVGVARAVLEPFFESPKAPA